MQKVLWTLVAGLLLAPCAYGQKFTKAFSSSGKKKIVLLLERAELTIEGYSGAELVIETEGYESLPERAKGLRPLYNGATDNTGIGLQVEESGNVITVKSASHQGLAYRIKAPSDADISVEEIGWQGDDFHISNINGEIEVKSNGSDILLENVTGPVVANSTSGDIEVIFSQLNQQRPTSISCVSGAIDVHLPATAKANLELSSISGEIYSDLDIKTSGGKDGMQTIGGRKITGTLNGGGVVVSLRAISDNIYLRKKK